MTVSKNSLDLFINTFVTGITTTAIALTFAPHCQANAPVLTAPSQNQSVNESTTALLKSISDLVQQFFPKAKITQTASSLHFEDRVHERMHPYIRRNVLSPDLDGILGDVEVKAGTAKDRMVGFIERPETIHSVLLMSPYSSVDKSVLSTRLVFQPITPMDFLESFKRLVNSYDTQDAPDVQLSKDNENSPNAKKTIENEKLIPPPAQTLDAAIETKNQNINKDAQVSSIQMKSQTPLSPSQAGLPMTKYTYPEGKFTVMLPVDPLVKYSDQAGMRMVDYVCTVPDGSFNVSYVILPSAPPNLKTSLLLENMSQTVINSFKGLHVKQSPITLQGFAGCQLSMPELVGKPGQSAELKIYIVQNFIYIIGVSGKSSFISAPNAKVFFETFQVNTEGKNLPKSAQKLQH